MEKELYGEMAALEETHWWFCGRRRVIVDVLARHTQKTHTNLLDVGIGTGLNARVFQEMGFTVTGLESSDEAISFATQKAPRAVIVKDLFPSSQIANNSYDVVTMFDVLEHIPNDEEALRDVSRVLRSSGIVFITVPAFPFLWSPHDVLAHHIQRYRKAQLTKLVREAGLEPILVSYYNFFLFLPIAAVRLLSNLLGKKSATSDFSRTPKMLNSILQFLFASERWLLRYTTLPFGVSLMVVARKP